MNNTKYLVGGKVFVPNIKTKNSLLNVEVVKGVLIGVGLFAILFFIAPTILG